MIHTWVRPADSCYISSGECVHLPASVEVWSDDRPGRLTISTLDYPGLTDRQLQEKAIALYRERCRYKPARVRRGNA